MVHFKSFRYWYWGFLVLIVVLFYVVNCLTPYFSDDWHYCMMIGANGEEDRRIENLSDVLVSNYYHYFRVNGRFIPHFFLMTFDALLGKQWFNVFNAFLFGLYLHLLNLNFVKERKNALMGLALSASLTLCFMCGFRYSFLWMSGVFNYEFVAVLVLFFNYLLNINIHSKWLISLLFLYGIICGWTNEAIVIGLSCVYIFHIKKRKEMKWSQVVLLSGFIIGVALCVFSPGSIHRALDKGGTGPMPMTAIMFTYIRSLFEMCNLRIFFIMLILWIYMKKMEWTWFIGVAITILFVAFTGHQSGQSRFGIELFSLVAILINFPYDKMKDYFGHVVLSLTAVYLLICTPYCVQNYRDFEDVTQQIEKTEDGIISTNVIYPSFYTARMVLPYNIHDEKNVYSYSVYNDWYNSMLACYFRRQDIKLYFFPKSFLNDVHDGLINEKFAGNKRYPFYARRLCGEDSIVSVKFVLGESRWASIPVVRTMDRFSAREVVAHKWFVMELYGVKYLLVKENPVIQDRVVDIKCE